jgi:hypothetical protein
MGSVYIRPTEAARGDQTTAGRFAISRWGGPTTFQLSTLTVGTTPSRIVTNNPRRVYYLLSNIGSADVFLKFDSSVTTSAGLKLTSNTGVAEVNAADHGEEVISELWAISSAAGVTVMLLEVYRV